MIDIFISTILFARHKSNLIYLLKEKKIYISTFHGYTRLNTRDSSSDLYMGAKLKRKRSGGSRPAIHKIDQHGRRE